MRPMFMGIICNPISSFNTFITYYEGKKILGNLVSFTSQSFFLRSSQPMSYVKQKTRRTWQVLQAKKL